jgi:predicted permease
MDAFLKDIRHAAQHLYKSPGFTLTAVLILTMAIGANVVVFGVVNSLVLNPLPLPQAQNVYSIQPKGKGGIGVAYPNYLDMRSRLTTFAGVSVFRVARIGLDLGKSAQPVWGYEAGGNYFDMLGVQPAAGRFFHASDEHGINSSRYAVLSYACWQSRFNGDPSIQGKTVLLNKRPYTILGVAPKDFHGTERFFWPELWVPIEDEPEIEGYNWIESRNTRNAWLVGRLKPGVGVGQANAELTMVTTQLARLYPDINKYFDLHLTKPGFLGDELGAPVRAFLSGIMLMAGLVLLAACVNLGGMYAAKTLDRSREFAIRIALGSGRGRLIRQLCIECCMVALLGGATASLLGSFLFGLLNGYRLPLDLPIQLLVSPDATTYGLTCLVVLATAVLFSCIPAVRVWRSDPNQAIKSSNGPSGARSRFAFRDILLGVQVAICCLLVTASLVSLRGLAKAVNAPLGVQPQNVTLALFDATFANYKDADAAALQRRILDQAAALPGVTEAAFANSTPLSIDQSSTSIFPANIKAFTAENVSFYATYYQTSPNYFKTAGTRLRAGRDFTWHDNASAPSVAVVNETFAQALFKSSNVIGRRFAANERQIEIVGLVEDGKYTSLTEEPQPVLFFPILQQPNTSTALLVRSSLPSSAMTRSILKVISSADPGLPVFSSGDWKDSLEGLALFPARAASVALGTLALLALMLAITGVAALAGYSVSKRLRELAIRKAIGARNGQILACGLGRPLLLLGFGSLAGLLLAIAAGRVLASVVYQASTADAWVLCAAPLVMAICGILATALPARKALKVDAATLLKDS